METLAIFTAFLLLAALIRRRMFQPRKRRDIIPAFSQLHIRKP